MSNCRNTIASFAVLFLVATGRADIPSARHAPCSRMLVSHAEDDRSSSLRLLKALLTKMLDQGLIGDEEWNSVAGLFEGAEVPRHLTQNLTSGLYWRALRGLVHSVQNRQAVSEIVDEIKRSSSQQKVLREPVVLDSQSTVRQMKFVRIQGGLFEFPSDLVNPELEEKMLQLEIPYDFEVMDVPVTQAMWVQHMGKNNRDPSGRIPSEDFLAVEIGGVEVSFAPNYPAHQMAVVDAFEFANRLSESKGLPPAYVTQESAEKPGLVHYTFSEAHIGDVKGYRLPTHYEWLRIVSQVSRDRRKSKEPMEFYRKTGWYSDARWIDRKLREVGLLPPTLIDGQPLYDLFGNVQTWIHESYVESFLLERRPLIELTESSQSLMAYSIVGANAIDDLNDKVPLPERRHESRSPLRGGKEGLGLRLVRSLARGGDK